MTRYAIEVEDLHVYIGNKHILKGVNLRVPQSAITVILGPSGSGKSTLLRTINRLIELNPEARVRGRVRVMGIDVYSADPYEVRRMIGMVFQVPNPFPHMSIFDNVAIAAKINGVARRREELEKVVRWALEKAMLWDEVRDRLRDPPTKLSGGQQQRLCLARAIAMKPRILLLDEPTANIDVYNTVKIENALKSLVNELGMTVVLVTHMPQQALRIGDYVAVMYDGRIVEFGPVDQVSLNPRSEITKRLLRGEIG